VIVVILIAAIIMLPPSEGVIHHGGYEVSIGAMMEKLKEVQVVFIGEKHDDPLAHEWELYIWTALASEDRCLALEMFETDVQDQLDLYLAGEITLEELLESSRPWSNYLEDYHPMVSYAAENGIPVIAANVPRHFASAVARNGWQGLDNEGDPDIFESITVDSSSGLYRHRFLETMDVLMGEMSSMPMDPMNMYRAQLLKDAVMASSIEGISCLFVCGSFHSDYRSGIPDQLESGVSFLTVSVIGENEPWEADQADFVIVR
jgi:uncharacterized iron-regulated protein